MGGSTDSLRNRERPNALSGRVGPRPLGLHLATAAITWTASTVPGALLLAVQHGTDPATQIAAMAHAAKARFDLLLAGVHAYHAHPYRRTVVEPPAIWRSAGISILDYGLPGNADAPPVLVIPSLINRHYVMDLREEQSLLRFLAEAGLRPFLVVWADAGAGANDVTIDDIVVSKLDAALSIVTLHARRPPVVMGYCLGGLLALALAARWPGQVAGLVCLATPWDFHAGDPGEGATARLGLATMEPILQAFGCLPVDWVQTLFYAIDPFAVIDKFLRFAETAHEAPEAATFVALEDWVNDGIVMPAAIARTLLGEWYGQNLPGRGLWEVGGQLVQPQELDLPSLIIVPTSDRIVPPDSARALAEALPCGEAFEVANGHIGMVASRRAPEQVWRPLADWLLAVGKG